MGDSMKSNRLKNGSSSIQRKRSWVGFLFVLPFLTGFVIFFFIPFVWSIAYSFTGGVGGMRFVGLSHYQSLFASQAFQTAAVNTLRFLLIGVPLVIFFGLAVALVLYGEFKGNSLLRSVFLYPLTVPIAALITVVRFVFEKDGALNHMLSIFGMQGSDWLDSSAAFGVLILIFVWKNCGYNMLLFLAGLYAIPNELVQTAQLEGAKWQQILWYIRLPLLKPTFFFTAVVSMMNSFKIFREAYLIGGESPDWSIYMLQHFMNNNFRNLNYQRLSAAAFLVFLFICLIVGILFWWKRRGDVGV